MLFIDLDSLSHDQVVAVLEDEKYQDVHLLVPDDLEDDLTVSIECIGRARVMIVPSKRIGVYMRGYVDALDASWDRIEAIAGKLVKLIRGTAEHSVMTLRPSAFDLRTTAPPSV